MARLPRSPIQRQSILNRSMLPGGVNGRSALVAPEPRPLAPTLVQPPSIEVAPWSAAGAIAVTTSGEQTTWIVGQAGGVGGIINEGTIYLSTAGSTSTVLTVYVNGASIGTLTYASGDTTPQTDTLTSTWVDVGDRVSARITTAGSGAKGLSAFVPIKG